MKPARSIYGKKRRGFFFLDRKPQVHRDAKNVVNSGWPPHVTCTHRTRLLNERVAERWNKTQNVCKHLSSTSTHSSWLHSAPREPVTASAKRTKHTNAPTSHRRRPTVPAEATFPALSSPIGRLKGCILNPFPTPFAPSTHLKGGFHNANAWANQFQ